MSPNTIQQSFQNRGSGGALPEPEVRREIMARAMATLGEALVLTEVLDELEQRFRIECRYTFSDGTSPFKGDAHDLSSVRIQKRPRLDMDF